MSGRAPMRRRRAAPGEVGGLIDWQELTRWLLDPMRVPTEFWDTRLEDFRPGPRCGNASRLLDDALAAFAAFPYEGVTLTDKLKSKILLGLYGNSALPTTPISSAGCGSTLAVSPRGVPEESRSLAPTPCASLRRSPSKTTGRSAEARLTTDSTSRTPSRAFGRRPRFARPRVQSRTAVKLPAASRGQEVGVNTGRVARSEPGGSGRWRALCQLAESQVPLSCWPLQKVGMERDFEGQQACPRSSTTNEVTNAEPAPHVAEPIEQTSHRICTINERGNGSSGRIFEARFNSY